MRRFYLWFMLQAKLSKTFGNKYIFKSSITTYLSSSRWAVFQHLLASYHLSLRASPLCTFECLPGQQHPQACEQAENNREKRNGSSYGSEQKEHQQPMSVVHQPIHYDVHRSLHKWFLFPFPNLKHGGLQNPNHFLAEEIQHYNCAWSTMTFITHKSRLFLKMKSYNLITI